MENDNTWVCLLCSEPHEQVCEPGLDLLRCECVHVRVSLPHFEDLWYL